MTNDGDPFTLELTSSSGETTSARVTRFSGRERVNGLFRFDIHAQAEANADETPAALIAASCVLRLWSDGALARSIHGVVDACSATGRDGSGRRIVRYRLAPRLSLLRWRKTSRIFQDMTAREIIASVLRRGGIQSRWVIDAPLATRPYCVQYAETDLDFVRRLCASEGILFYFEDPADASPGDGSRPDARVVFSNTSASYLPIVGDAELRYRPIATAGGALVEREEAVRMFRVEARQRATATLLRRYDFERPHMPLHASAATDGRRASERREVMRGFVDDDLTVYEHQHARERAPMDPIPAQHALEAERADAATATGSSPSRRLVPGHTFRLREHDLPHVDGAYVVASVRHKGVAPGWSDGEPVYDARFEAAPAATPLRAERASIRTPRQTLETATVVGPVGEEIHTDTFGRVKVRFHWDLAGNGDQHASAWLRVAQAWAGAGYGAQFLPRVGHEVIVGYVDGDTDRPVVLGSLHNVATPTPFTFPVDRAQSGIVTRSTPGGAGGNALLFDDKAGSESVTLSSNRTMGISAVANASLNAGIDMNIAAGGDLRRDVVGDVTSTTQGAEAATIGTSRHTTIGTTDTLEVAQDREVHIGGAETTEVRGVARHVYAGPRTTIVGAEGTADEQLGVSGIYRVGSVRDMRFSSRTSIILECGTSKIVIGPDRVLIDAAAIHLQATDEIALVQGVGGGATLTLKGSASLGGATVACVAGGKDGLLARLFLDTKAHLDGVEVLLNCGPLGAAGGTRDGLVDETGVVEFTFESGDVPEGVTSVTLFIATPSGEIVQRECAVGGSVEMTGRVGDVFTVVEARIGDQRIHIHTGAGSQGPTA